MKIAHIINTFQPDTSSDLYFAQQVTLETIRNAKREASGTVNVDVCCVSYPEDKQVIPPDFIALPYLKESVLEKANFVNPRKLPLIAEILDVVFQRIKADFYIYSNIDISLYPDFYLQVFKYLKNGYDALIINRRRISPKYHSINNLHLIYKQKGKKHPGFDCFVFHKSIVSKFFFANLCIGVPFFEISFSQNLFAFSNRLHWIKDGNQTFHIGMEIFKRRQPKEYIKYNRSQYYQIIEKIWPSLSIRKMPYYNDLFPIRFIKWGLHPCFPIRLMINLQLKDWNILKNQSIN